uniref:Right handed beta helix domain-containing protein n=2 Tax=Emiliania huxleyi TaxID=2903 RepID=A0A0D3IP50_EMIH1
MADSSAPGAPAVPSDGTAGRLRPPAAGVRARPDAASSPLTNALLKRPADRPAGEHERAASRSRGAAPRMDALGSVEKDPGASASTRTAEAPAVAARQTRANSAQLALEPIALSNRLETMLLGNHPVPAPSNEVSVASEVSNSIILVAKAAVDALFSSPQRAALMALGLRDLKPAALAYLVWDLRGVLAGARHDQAVAAASVRFRRSGSRGSVALLLLLPFLPASWDLWCGGEVVLSSAPYTGSDQASGEPFQTEYGVSLSPGVECELHMYDSYGDGWNGASWSGLGQEGLTVASGSEERKSFVVPEVSWDLWCGGTVVLSSAPYASGEPFQAEYGVSLSPGVECELVMKDSYGDGWDGASWSGLGQEGLTVASGSEERKSFVYVAVGYTFSGAPYYRAPSSSKYIYWDPDCNGGSGGTARWIVDSDLPSIAVSSDLDRDGSCNYIARINSDDSSSPPLGTATWRDEINEAVDQGRNASVIIPPGARLAFSSNVGCSGAMHLSVRSSGEGATLDGKKSSRMFSISSGCSLYLEALHFVDGRGDRGGAVRAYGAGDLAMKDVSFTGCEATENGGGMNVESSGDVSLEGASFSKCTARNYGGGMLVYQNSGDVSLEGASFSECTADYGGGMLVENSGDVALERASFSECTADNGGGMSVENSGDIALEGASFVGCTSGTQAALYLTGIERLALTNSQFVDNIASQTPAALFYSSRIAATDSILRNTTFSGNSAPGSITILAASPL